MWKPPLFPAWYLAGNWSLDFSDFHLWDGDLSSSIPLLSVMFRKQCPIKPHLSRLFCSTVSNVPLAFRGHICLHYAYISVVMSCMQFLYGFVSSREHLLWWLCSILAWASLLIQTPVGTCPTLPLPAEKTGWCAGSQLQVGVCTYFADPLFAWLVWEVLLGLCLEAAFILDYKTIIAKDTCFEAWMILWFCV